MAAADDAFAEWSRRHGGYDVERSRSVRAWLRLVHAIAAPMAQAGVHPDVVTGAAVAAAATALTTGRRRAAMFVVVSSVLDGVDGAVAVRRRTSTAHGERLDHTADRVSDVLFAAALRRAGAPSAVAAAAAVSTLAFEAARSRLRGGGQPLRVCLGDRPFRVIATVMGLVSSPTVGALVVIGQTATGLAQLRHAERHA